MNIELFSKEISALKQEIFFLINKKNNDNKEWKRISELSLIISIKKAALQKKDDINLFNYQKRQTKIPQ